MSKEIREILITPPTVSGSIRAMGLTFNSVFTLILTAGLKTSFSEEILFRGFIGKRLIKALGFLTGNILQAVIFALVHVLLFWAMTQAQPSFLIFIFFFSGTAGFLIEYINEKFGNGSILPGWLAHGLGNMISYTILAYIL